MTWNPENDPYVEEAEEEAPDFDGDWNEWYIQNGYDQFGKPES